MTTRSMFGIGIGFLGIVSLTTVDRVEAQMLWGRCERGALANLEINQVVVSSWLPKDKAQQLYERAIQRLAEAGIHPKRKTPTPLGYPSLEVTFDAIDLSQTGPNALFGNTIPGKWLYREKLEVWEHVYSKRYPDKPIEAIVCFTNGRLPRIIDNSPFEEQLRSNLDELLDIFIKRYRQENPDKK